MPSTVLEKSRNTSSRKTTSRAASLTAPGVVRIDEVEVRDPGPGEVRIRIEGCGLCASSMPLWEGRKWFSYPTEHGAPGHEGWGRIDAVGAGVTEVKVGDRVAALSYHAFAEHDFAPASAVVRLPDSLDGAPFPGEPVACAVNIMARSEIEEGDTVAVIGIGFLGALLTRLAANAGARVIAISRRSSSLALARRYGAHEAVLMDDHQRIIDEVMSMTDGEGCHRVIEATGKQWPLDLAAELVRVRGRLIIAGYHQDGPRQVNMQLWNWRGIDVINAHERDEAVYLRGMREAVALVEAGHLDLTPLLSHEFTLDQLGEAFRLMEERPDGFVKAWINLDGGRA